MELRDEALKALETVREQKIINKNFEAELTIELSETSQAIKEIKDLATIFIVSKINFVNKIDDALVNGKIGKIKANLRQGVKCERC
jgi:isoleucyl-tRNA synthetase